MLASCDKTRPIYLRRPLAEVELSARAHSTAAVQSKEMVFFLRFFQQHLFVLCVCSLFILNIIMNAVATQLEREEKSVSAAIRAAHEAESLMEECAREEFK